MIGKLWFVVAATSATLTVGGSALSADHEYIGAQKCRPCHLIEYKSWEKTPHARALDSLKPEEQAKAECVSCHVTGGRKELAGVQCEACHGPGKDYAPKEIMKKAAKSKAAGLLVPDEKSCRGCHNEKSPQFKGFDFPAMVKKVHQHKKS